MLQRFSSVKSFMYNNKLILLKAESFKGWQISIFNDGIQGRFDIQISREIEKEELKFLKDKYSFLNDSQFDTMVKKISLINISEMLPYYIMRYGFYEGHTDYRADPVAIAFIFNLKSIQEIEEAFTSRLFNILIK